jgi:ketosteroid isomerase-like protein
MLPRRTGRSISAMTTIETTPTVNERTWFAQQRHLEAGDMDAWADLWAPDGRMRVAYPIAGVPPELEGRETIKALMTGFASAVDGIAYREATFHPTLDPDVAFAEHLLHVDLPGGGAYENRYAMRLRFRDGLLLELVEYYGERAHEDFLRALGVID